MAKKRNVEIIKKCKWIISSLILHNVSEEVKDFFMVNYFDFKEILEQGVSMNQYRDFLIKNDDTTVGYLITCLSEWNNLEKNLLEFKEIHFAYKIKIAVVGLKKEIREDYFTWIKGIEIRYFNDIGEATAFLCSSEINFELNQRRYDFNSFCKDMKFDATKKKPDIFSEGFFRNLFQTQDVYQTVMMEFEYIEFILLLVYYYYKIKCNNYNERKNRIPKYLELTEDLLEMTKECDSFIRIQDEIIDINFDLECTYSWFNDKYGLNIKGEKLNFYGMMTILQELRNRTKGHGTISQKSGKKLRKSLYYHIALLNKFLNLEEFVLEVREGEVYCGYGNDLLPMSPYLILEDDILCVSYELRKEKREYINYFQGNYTLPQFMESKR